MKPTKPTLVFTVAVGIAIACAPMGQAQTGTGNNTHASSSKTRVVEPDILWAHTYGDDDLFAADVIETSDGDFAVTGQYQFLTSSGDQGGDVYLLKVRADGLKLSQAFDDYGPSRFYSGSFIQQTEDMGFVVAGSGTKLLPPSTFFYLAKYNADGIRLWSKEYRPANRNCECMAATATRDGGYLMVGMASVAVGVDYIYVVKTDSLGAMEWNAVISNPAGLGDTTAVAHSVTEAPGGYAITGEVTDYESGISSAFLLRLNVFGKVIARQHYNFLLPGTVKTDVAGRSLQYTRDGFIIAGSAIGYTRLGLITPRAAFLLKVSTSGKVRWCNLYGLGTFSSASSVCETRDGGYILTGTTDIYDISSPVHAYIARTDKDGNELWSKTITEGDYAKYAVSAGSKVIETVDGGYIIAGMAVPSGAADTLMVRLGPDIVREK